MSQITVKQAVAAAKEEMNSLYEDDPLTSLALEEIELVDEAGVQLWAVTLGFYRAKSIAVKQQGGVSSIYQPQPASQIENRDYKTIYIDAETGTFVKMEIRPAP